MGLIVELTYVSHMTVLEVDYSPKLMAFFKSIFPVLTFDAFPSDDIFEWMFGLSVIDDEPLSEKFEEIGYGTKMVFSNLGSLLIF